MAFGFSTPGPAPHLGLPGRQMLRLACLSVRPRGTLRYGLGVKRQIEGGINSDLFSHVGVRPRYA